MELVVADSDLERVGPGAGDRRLQAGHLEPDERQASACLSRRECGFPIGRDECHQGATRRRSHRQASGHEGRRRRVDSHNPCTAGGLSLLLVHGGRIAGERSRQRHVFWLRPADERH